MTQHTERDDAVANQSEPVATLAMVTLDAPGPQEAATLGQFWQAVLGWPVAYEAEGIVMLQGPSHALGIGAVESFRAPNWPDDGAKQFHFDLAATDVEAAAARCVELGAVRPEQQPGETWIVLLDPVGHPFCVTNAEAWQ